MTMLKDMGYDFIGIWGSTILIIGIIILSIYSFILKMIFHPLEMIEDLLRWRTQLQNWVDKKVGDRK